VPARGGHRAVRRDVYIQHNPAVADEKDALIEYFTRMAREYPGQARGVQAGDRRGQLRGAALLPGVAGDGPWAGMDIFRLDDNGKIIEHWDVLQRVPGSSANTNTIF
jgi:predicted SnoaL-like aldol condensation-catalyzing enzyme